MSGDKHRVTGTEQDVAFGKWLRRTRESKGLQVVQLAKLAGDMSPTTLTEYEKGYARKAPSVNVYERLAKGLDVELSYVLHQAGHDMGKGGVNMARLERIELIVEAFDLGASEIRLAMAEAMERLDAMGADATVDRLGRALGAFDLVTERVRIGRSSDRAGVAQKGPGQ